MRPSPFSWIHPSSEKGFLICAAAVAVALMTAMNSIGRPLKNAASPQGIVSFELAGNLARAEEILDAWGEPGRLAAALSLGLDFLFLFAYPIAIGLACSLISRALQSRMRPLSVVGEALAWALPAAGVLDGVENWALIRLLFGASQPALPSVAYGCAVVKFVIVLAGLAFVIIFGAVAAALARRPAAGG